MRPSACLAPLLPRVGRSIIHKQFQRIRRDFLAFL